MNRAQRRAGLALSRPGMRLPWQPFERVPESDRPELFAQQRERVGDLQSVWKNNRYIVQIYRRALGGGAMEASHLAVRRNDESEIQGWDDLQRIKNELAGGDRVALEIYPPEAEVIDQANMRHLFVLPAGTVAPFTIRGRWE